MKRKRPIFPENLPNKYGWEATITSCRNILFISIESDALTMSLFFACCVLHTFREFFAGDSLNTETSVETRIVNTDREFSYRCYSSLSSLESREQRPRVKKKNNKITKLKKKLRNETRNRMFLLNYHQINSSRHHATILFLVRISLVSPAIFRPS